MPLSLPVGIPPTLSSSGEPLKKMSLPSAKRVLPVSKSFAMVPMGTSRISSFPFAPVLRALSPFPPSSLPSPTHFPFLFPLLSNQHLQVKESANKIQMHQGTSKITHRHIPLRHKTQEEPRMYWHVQVCEPRTHAHNGFGRQNMAGNCDHNVKHCDHNVKHCDHNVSHWDRGVEHCDHNVEHTMYCDHLCVART